VCGILGVGGPRGAEWVGRLLGGLAHRGPDDEGRWSSPELALGHRRLAIIGLDAGGRQPMRSRSGESVIVFNGEIYNYLELADRLEAAGRAPDRRYDTAVLLEALECWGRDVLPELNGMFAFAWYRPGARRLLLARDRFGKKPLYWGTPRGEDGRRVLVFSSELRSFTRGPGGAPPPDPLGVARYLVYDGMPDATTVYRDVAQVPAASWVELDPDGQVHGSGDYWRFDPHPAPIAADEACARYEAALERSLALRLRSDVPVGVFLSGGIDSSLLAATWRRIRPGDRIRTFTVGFEESSYDERASARLLAETIGAEHHEITATGSDLEREIDAVWRHLPEPLGDPSIVPTSLLCRFAREHAVVALGGDGGDELQAGYAPFRAWQLSSALEHVLPRAAWAAALRGVERALPADARNLSTRFVVRHFAQGLRHPADERVSAWLAAFAPRDALAAMDPDLAREVDPEAVLEPTRRAFAAARGAGPLYAQIHAWIRTYLVASVLAKVDRASMMHSLEVRAPLLDPDLTELLASLPPALIYARGRGKVLMRRAAQHLLPPALLDKPKQGFGVPQADWLRTVLRERMEDCLARTRRGGWFRPAPIEALWRDHLDRRADYRRALWTFLFSFPFQDV
jgi:asparagine synthase (glutamine-hydrolysing)